VADKLDSVVGLFSAGERPTGTRDPFGMRRQTHGALKILVDLPELTGISQPLTLEVLLERASQALGLDGIDAFSHDLLGFVRDRLRHLFIQRGHSHEELEAVLGAADRGTSPLRTRWRLEALRTVRGSADFAGLAELFKRVKNIAREISPHPLPTYPVALDRTVLTEPAEQALLAEFDRRARTIRAASDGADYAKAMTEAAALRQPVDRFFAEVFVMVEDAKLRNARLRLLVDLRDLILGIADISHLAPVST
jgi:glycyl-tRNA synthetase beta chain